MRDSKNDLVLGKHAPSLARWGRSPDADLIYRTLVTLGPRTAAALGRDLGLSSRRITMALEELAAVGVASRATAVWTPATPAEVVTLLNRPRPAGEWDERQRLTGRLIADARKFGDGLTHLRTRALTRVRLAELVDVARHEHLAMNTEPAFDAESARAAVPTDRTLLRRGVRMRVLGLQPAYPDPMLTYGRAPSEPSPDYREAPVVPMKLLILDRGTALFPVDPNDFDRGYLEVTQPPLVAALRALFETHWANGRDPEERAVADIFGPRERALIRLLAEGHTDETAARELRISTRSVSNIMRALMDQFGVDNRFQLGLALGALRVASPPRKPEQEPT